MKKILVILSMFILIGVILAGTTQGQWDSLEDVDDDFIVEAHGFSGGYPFYKQLDGDLNFKIECAKKVTVYLVDDDAWIDSDFYYDYGDYSEENVTDWLEDHDVKKWSGSSEYDEKWTGGSSEETYWLIIHNPNDTPVNGNIKYKLYGGAWEDSIEDAAFLMGMSFLICCVGGLVIVLVLVAVVVIIIVWVVKGGKKKEEPQQQRRRR
jgi:hypothetical protein